MGLSRSRSARCSRIRQGLLVLLALILGFGGYSAWSQVTSLAQAELGRRDQGIEEESVKEQLSVSQVGGQKPAGQLGSEDGSLHTGHTSKPPGSPTQGDDDWRLCRRSPILRLQRGYIPKACQDDWDAPVLWSFPGSGNTWMRNLLETSTGYYTGSVYNDRDLKTLFPGEFTCDNTVLATKAHPTFTSYEVLRNWAAKAPIAIDDMPWHGQELSPWDHCETTFQHYGKKCKAWKPQRALIIDREPFSAIWAEYQRLVSGEHTAVITNDRFDQAEFMHEALRLAQSYLTSWASYNLWQRHVQQVKSPVYIVPFQDMVDNCPGAMKKILQWLKPPRHPKGLAWQVSVACDQKEGRIKRDKSKAVSTARVWTQDLVCRVWSIVGNVCAQRGHKPGPRDVDLRGVCSTRSELVLALAARVASFSPDGRTVVLTTTSAGYAHVTLNWLINLRRRDSQIKPLIAALDWDSHDTFNRLGAMVFPMIPRYSPVGRHRREGFRRFDGVWIERGEVIQVLLDAGYHVLNCDSDAVWRMNVVPGLASLTRLNDTVIHAIASSGTFPVNLRDALGGATAVMGFILLRSTPEMRSFFHDMQDTSLDYGDDQVAFNSQLVARRAKPVQHLALQQHEPVGDTSAPERIFLNGSTVLHVPATDRGTQTALASMSILLLPEAVVMRNCDSGNIEGAAVVHCLTDKDGKTKGNKLEQIGLWACPVHWEQRMLLHSWPGHSAAKLAAAQAAPAPVLSHANVPDGAELERRLESLAGFADIIASIIVCFEGGGSADEDAQTQADFESLVLNLVHGTALASIKMELLVIAWNISKDDSLELAEALTMPATRNLRVRLIRAPDALRAFVLRRHTNQRGLVHAASFNMGVRLASSQHVVCTFSGTIFSDGFFRTLASLRQGVEYDVQVITGCLVSDAKSLMELLNDQSRAEDMLRSGKCTSTANIAGVLAPVTLWALIEGMPESPILAEDADLHFGHRLRSSGFTTSWMRCGQGTSRCAVSASSSRKSWWRFVQLSPWESMLPGSSRSKVAMPPQDVQLELDLLRDAGARLGLDSNCRWGLAGQTVFELSSEAPRTEAELKVPYLETGGDRRGNVLMSCSTETVQRKAWMAWKTRAHYQHPLMVVKVEGGLGNRLRALFSGWALADALGYTFVGIWEPDVECGATFYDLFEGLEKILILDFRPWGSEGPGKGWVQYDGIAKGVRIALPVEHSTRRNVYIRTQNFILSQLKKHRLEAYSKRFVRLSPRGDDLNPILQHLISRVDMKFVVGAHVRMSGNESANVFGVDMQLKGIMGVELSSLHWQSKEGRKGLMARRAECHWRNFTDPARRLLIARQRQKPAPMGKSWRLMLACDQASCLEGVRQSFDGEVISLRDYIPSSFFTECNFDERSVLCQRLALLEILMLQYADGMLLSQPSSFSDAIRFGILGHALLKEEIDRKKGKPPPKAWRPRFGIICGQNMDYKEVFAKDSSWYRLSEMPKGLIRPPRQAS